MNRAEMMRPSGMPRLYWISRYAKGPKPTPASAPFPAISSVTVSIERLAGDYA
jgi:hypothetical protein